MSYLILRGNIMAYDIFIDVKDGYLQVVVRGVSSLPDNIDLQKRVAQACKENKCTRVMVDIRELKNPTSITEIYQFGKNAEQNLRNVSIKAAVLHDEDRTEHESFLETTMKNRGVNLRSFLSEKDALKWLLK
jgi:hypothetical protein